jgi:soluble lytic murein transglycosylase-like protein
MGKGNAIVFAGIGLGILGVAMAVSRPAHATEEWIPKKGKNVGKTLKDAAKRLSAEVVASARKWATARALPLADVLTTILLESRGNPKALAKNAKEESRGLMQVNIRAHADTIKKLGYTPDGLYTIDGGIAVGTYLLASKRKAVQALLAKTKRKQEYDLGTLTRLYYVGPKYAEAWILKGQHFKNLEVYADHWRDAYNAIAETFGANS